MNLIARRPDGAAPVRASSWWSVSSLFRFAAGLAVWLCVGVGVGVSVAAVPARAAATEQTTSEKLVLIVRKIIVESAKVGIEEAGTRLMGSSWKYLKVALSPLLDELKRRYPSFASIIDGTSPNAEKQAAQISERIAADPRLQALVVDGFADLRAGQRDIVTRIGELQAVLYRQNESILALQRTSDEKLDRLLAQVDELARQRPGMAYTENFTLFDLAGTWTMVETQPPLPAACTFEEGEYGLVVNPSSASSATGEFSIPLVLDPSDKALLFPELDTLCPTVESGDSSSRTTQIMLLGSLIRLGLSSDSGYSFSREVQVSADKLILSWIDETNGRRHRWIFARQP